MERRNVARVSRLFLMALIAMAALSGVRVQADEPAVFPLRIQRLVIRNSRGQFLTDCSVRSGKVQEKTGLLPNGGEAGFLYPVPDARPSLDRKLVIELNPSGEKAIQIEVDLEKQNVRGSGSDPEIEIVLLIGDKVKVKSSP